MSWSDLIVKPIQLAILQVVDIVLLPELVVCPSNVKLVLLLSPLISSSSIDRTIVSDPRAKSLRPENCLRRVIG